VHKAISTIQQEVDIFMPKKTEPIKTIIVNPPTKEQAEEHVKKLSVYLSKIWKSMLNAR
jgi:tRNA1(Val) A37 N6-methylase TrmN6